MNEELKAAIELNKETVMLLKEVIELVKLVRGCNYWWVPYNSYPYQQSPYSPVYSQVYCNTNNLTDFTTTLFKESSVC